jgi:hypothetical protein
MIELPACPVCGFRIASDADRCPKCRTADPFGALKKTEWARGSKALFNKLVVFTVAAALVGYVVTVAIPKYRDHLTHQFRQ